MIAALIAEFQSCGHDDAQIWREFRWGAESRNGVRSVRVSGAIESYAIQRHFCMGQILYPNSSS